MLIANAFPRAQKKCKLVNETSPLGYTVEVAMDEELDKLKPVGLPVDKQQWNIEDLNAYITR